MCFNCKKKKIEKNSEETVLVQSQTNYSGEEVQLLISEIVVHNVHEYK